RVAFHPFDCERSVGFGRARADLDCATFRPLAGFSEIRWRTVVDSSWESLMAGIVGALPTRDVYLSIDKDCLNADGAVSNWEAGGLTLEQVLSGIAALRSAKAVVGADITGEYSPVEISNPMFRRLAASERPKLSPPTDADLE